MDKILTIIPAYNKEEFLEGAIESILQQTHTNVELIIVDDCSIDKTLEIAKSYEHLKNVTVLHNKINRGAYYSSNQGLEYALNLEWDYMGLHGADDLSDINRYSKLLPFFEDSSLMGLKSTYLRVDKNLQPQLTPQGDTYDVYASEGIALYPRKTINLLGYYDNTRFSGDTDYWWRLEAFCSVNPQYKVGISDEILYYAVNHENNLTKTNPISSRAGYYRKLQGDIKQMIANGNFYRNKFE